jgi:hypothetical protein
MQFAHAPSAQTPSCTLGIAQGSAAAHEEGVDESSLFEDQRRRGSMRCPHCRSIANRRSSAEVTPTYWDIYYTCSDPRCGHTWKAALSYVYGLSPSAVPDPSLDLPMRAATRAEVVKPELPPPDDPNQPRLF